MTVTPIDFTEYKIELDDIFLILDAINNQWKKNKRENFKFIILLGSFKLAIRAMPEDFVIIIFNNLFKGIDTIYQMAGFRKLSKDGDFTGAKDFFRKTVIRQIESGELFNLGK